jgi:hypothetical protein
MIYFYYVSILVIICFELKLIFLSLQLLILIKVYFLEPFQELKMNFFAIVLT